MSDRAKEISVNLDGSAAPPRPRHMYVLFTLEHRAYSIGEVCELAERLKAGGVEDLYCIKLDCEAPERSTLLMAEEMKGSLRFEEIEPKRPIDPIPLGSELPTTGCIHGRPGGKMCPHCMGAG